MDEVVFCEGCHRVLSVEFHFCPYCGRKLAGQHAPEANELFPELPEEAAEQPPETAATFAEMVDESLDRVQETVREYTLRRLEEMGDALSKLESELDRMAGAHTGPGQALAGRPHQVHTVGSGSQAGQSTPGDPL
ncbi:hypothetical protein [Salinispira pacifica]